MTRSLALVALLVGCCILLGAGTSRTNTSRTVASVVTAFRGDAAAFSEILNDLAAAPADSTLQRARQQYKKLEYLIEYLDPEAVKLFNGPNLVKPDPNVLSTAEIPPSGLQVLEELVLNDDTDDQADMARLCHKLQADLQAFLQSGHLGRLTDRMVFEACRAEVLNVMFKGIVGFDAPVGLTGIGEAAAALRHQAAILTFYADFGDQYAPIEYAHLRECLSNAVSYLIANPDFETFNRLEFIRERGLPLYEAWYFFHRASGIELPSEASTEAAPVRYQAASPFDTAFLNPWYYSRYKQDGYREASAALGRLLFFDPALSVNNQRACASCHRPELAFTDGAAKSTALDFKGTVSRNSPTLLNAAFQSDFFYDARENALEEQIQHVVQSHQEFGTDMEAILKKLRSSAEYRRLFEEAFPQLKGRAIDGFSVNKALADYVRTLTSFDAPFDWYMRGEIPALDSSVVRGFNLFMGKALCGTCHFAPVFNGTVPPQYTETEMEVLGVPVSSAQGEVTDPDAGRFNIQHAAVNLHAFKTPTVRNAALTAPYMHNGAYGTLREVMDFYNKGGGNGMGQDLPNQTLPFDALHLTEAEIDDIIAFLQSLTDNSKGMAAPLTLPAIPGLKGRKPGGVY